MEMLSTAVVPVSKKVKFKVFLDEKFKLLVGFWCFHNQDIGVGCVIDPFEWGVRF